MFCEEIRRQAEGAPRAALPAVSVALWKAFAEGHVTEAEAESLAAVIERRQQARQDHEVMGAAPAVASLAPTSPTKRHGSRPRTDGSLERRRRWAASGRLPPALAARFTLAEQAVLALVAAETARSGDCRLAVSHMAAVTGVSRSTVKGAIREARKLGLLSVEERRVAGRRSHTNVVRVIALEWVAWLRWGRRGGGVKSATASPTHLREWGKLGKARPSSRSIAVPNPVPEEGSRAADAPPRRRAW